MIGDIIAINRCRTCRRTIVLWRLGKVEFWRHMTEGHEPRPVDEFDHTPGEGAPR